jgi:site-specific DNA-methyltransferase (adenine-specific)
MIICGDCLEVMRGMDATSVDAIVTDPPYGLSFMGKDWDHGIPGVHFWVEALRVAKPGCHLLAFGGTRTFHRLACAIEDAGWEIRDCLGWMYGSGFPKSHNVSKALDREAGATRPTIGKATSWNRPDSGNCNARMNVSPGEYDVTAPATDSARQWEGWGTALKPAWEPIILARKPLDGTVAANVLKWGTGAINVDGCRVPTSDTYAYPNGPRGNTFTVGQGPDGSRTDPAVSNAQGRWPANLLHDGSDEVLELFPQAKGNFATRGESKDGQIFGYGNDRGEEPRGFGDSGSAARFFYCAKASRKEREMGCEGMPVEPWVQWQTANGTSGKPSSLSEGRHTAYANRHPTVKPLALMRYLCRLVTPPAGTILDPFMGSGTTLIAAEQEGCRAVGIELNEEHCEIARRRTSGTLPQ